VVVRWFLFWGGVFFFFFFFFTLQRTSLLKLTDVYTVQRTPIRNNNVEKGHYHTGSPGLKLEVLVLL